MIERRFKFDWTHTRPDRLNDFSAADGKRWIGRVHKLPGIDERWKWGMTASNGHEFGSIAGIEGTRDKACDAVERRYEAMKAALPQADGVRSVLPITAGQISPV